MCKYGVKIGVNIGVNIGVKVGVNIGVNIGVNMQKEYMVCIILCEKHAERAHGLHHPL